MALIPMPNPTITAFTKFCIGNTSDNAVIASSLIFATKKLSDMISHARIKPDTVIYMDYGAREMRHHNNMRIQFSKVTSQLLQKQILLESRIVPNGDHCEASWEKQIPFFMNTLLYEF